MRTRSATLIAVLLILCAAFLPSLSPALAVASSPSVQSSIFLPLVNRPADVRLLTSDFSFVSSISGDLHILGEVYNGLPYPVSYIRIRVSIFDRQGHRLPVANPYAGLLVEDLDPGAKSCFDLVILDPPAGWYSYTFDELSYESGHYLPVMTVVYSSAAYESNGEYRISGLVRNDHGRRVEGVKPVGTLYNAAGRVIGCSEAYVDGFHLNPGFAGAFMLNYYGRNYSDAASYRIEVHGYPQ